MFQYRVTFCTKFFRTDRHCHFNIFDFPFSPRTTVHPDTAVFQPFGTFFFFKINGCEYEQTSVGDGQYDAFMRALRQIYKHQLGREFPMLRNYTVSIPPGGRTDAFVQTIITWETGGKEFKTRGLDADQTEAAIKATIKMLNIIEPTYNDHGC